MEKLQRMIEIHDLIEREPCQWTCRLLGEKFGVTKQQISRDIKKLRKSGYRIESTYRGYRIEKSPEKSSPPGG